jgi:hypothetical protein
LGVYTRFGTLSLTSSSAGDYDPAWSADGQWIAYDRGDLFKISANCNADETPCDIVVNTNQFQRLTHAVNGDCDGPSWNWAEGKTSLLALSCTDTGNRELYFMDVTQVDEDDEEDPRIQLTEYIIAQDHSPDWSPDGNQIVFAANREAPEQNAATSLYLGTLNTDFEPPRQLTSIGFWSSSPSWGRPASVMPTCPTVRVVAANPGRSQEALDMLAVANENGLILHDGPTLNATRMHIGDETATIPWGTTITVSDWVEFEQEGRPSWVWYKVIDAGSLTPEVPFDENDQWIAARISSTENQHTVTYSYIEGVDESIHRCESQPPYTGEITFVYDRSAAAEYAIAHSYANNISRPSLRVTAPLARIFGDIPQLENLDIPFADFPYSDLSAGTGSAMFISEVIWIGGLPMTVGLDGSCVANPDSSYPEPGLGWRYCSIILEPESQRTTSPTWDNHQYLVSYYTTGSTTQGDVINTILNQSEQGRQILFEKDDEIRLTAEDLRPYLYLSGGTLTEGRVTDFTNFVRTHLGALRQGDYMWIDSFNDIENKGDLHGLIIVGWREPQNCSDVISGDILSLDDFSPTLPITGDYVPYVADFTGVQQPIPRPFYCTWYKTGDDNYEGFVRHRWYFYTILNENSAWEGTVNLNIDEIYVNSSWLWSENND